MPEAVVSNSTAAPNEQHAERHKVSAPKGVPVLHGDAPFEALSPRVQEDFDAVGDMLRAFSAMSHEVLSSGKDFSIYSNGMWLIHQLIMYRLDQVAEDARLTIDAIKASRFLDTGRFGDEDLTERLGNVVRNALIEAGYEAYSESMAKWDDASFRLYSATMSSMRTAMNERLGEDTHLINVGVALAWAETHLRTQFGASKKDDQNPTDVERIIARLKGKEEAERKAAG